MVISFKRISIFLVVILSLALSPILISDSNLVHAAKQDDVATLANSKKGKRSGHFKGFTPGAWCSDFVYWALKENNLMNGKTFPKKRVGGTNGIQSHFTKKGQYKKATKKFQPQKGDLAIFGSSTHIGIVTKVKGNYVWVTHGNWSNKVCITKIKKTGHDRKAYARIKGYVRLDYRASEPNVTVKYNTDGGEVDKVSKKVRNTDKIGALPVPEKEGYEFIGWYTQKSGGKKITKNFVVDIKKTMTIYAKYKKIEVEEEELPEDTVTDDGIAELPVTY